MGFGSVKTDTHRTSGTPACSHADRSAVPASAASTPVRSHCQQVMRRERSDGSRGAVAAALQPVGGGPEEVGEPVLETDHGHASRAVRQSRQKRGVGVWVIKLFEVERSCPAHLENPVPKLSYAVALSSIQSATARAAIFGIILGNGQLLLHEPSDPVFAATNWNPPVLYIPLHLSQPLILLLPNGDHGLVGIDLPLCSDRANSSTSSSEISSAFAFSSGVSS